MRTYLLLFVSAIIISLPTVVFCDENYEKDLKAADARCIKDPTNARAWYERAMVNYEHGKYLITFGNYEKEKPFYRKAIPDFNKAIELDPKYLGAIHYRGWNYYRIGMNKEAEADFHLIIKIDPSYELAYNGLGAIYEHQNRIDDAIAMYTKNIDMYSEAAHAWANRADCYRKKKEYKKAIADFDRSLKIDPAGGMGQASAGATYAERARTYLEMKEIDKALEDFNRAVELNPENPSFYISRGKALRQKYMNEEAAEDYEKAAKLDPSNADPFILRGNIFLDADNKGFAGLWYNKAVKADPNSSWAWHSKGLVDYYSGNYPQAMQNFEKAAGFSPKWEAPVSLLGFCALNTKKYPDAVSYFEKAMALDPTCDHYAGRGEVYLETGRTDEAIADFRRAIKMGFKGDWINNKLAEAFAKKSGKTAQPAAAPAAGAATGGSAAGGSMDLGDPDPKAETVK